MPSILLRCTLKIGKHPRLLNLHKSDTSLTVASLHHDNTLFHHPLLRSMSSLSLLSSAHDPTSSRSEPPSNPSSLKSSCPFIYSLWRRRVFDRTYTTLAVVKWLCRACLPPNMALKIHTLIPLMTSSDRHHGQNVVGQRGQVFHAWMTEGVPPVRNRHPFCTAEVGLSPEVPRSLERKLHHHSTHWLTVRQVGGVLDYPPSLLLDVPHVDREARGHHSKIFDRLRKRG